MMKLSVIGRLGKDALVNDVNGKKVINFSVAHSEQWKDAQGEKQERTTWIDCAKWGDNVNVAQYLTKGTQVYVEGNPEVRSYERSDGSTGVSLSCRVAIVQLLGSASSKPASSDSSDEEPEGSEAAEGKGKEKLPF